MAVTDLFIRDPKRSQPLKNLRQSVRIRMRRQAADLSHDFSHITRVWRNVGLIAAESIPAYGWTVDGDVLEAAVYLHEIGRGAELGSETSNDASARLAEEMLRTEGLADLVWPVGETIVSNTASRSPVSPESKLLRDADSLEELGAIGVARAFISGASQATPSFYDTEDPAAKSRALDDSAFLIDQFPSRLFGIADSMQTDFGRKEADRRIKVLRAFYIALLKESGFDV